MKRSLPSLSSDQVIAAQCAEAISRGTAGLVRRYRRSCFDIPATKAFRNGFEGWNEQQQHSLPCANATAVDARRHERDLRVHACDFGQAAGCDCRLKC